VTALSLASIAITIGATTVVFSAVKSVLLDPFPYAHADLLVQLRAVNPKVRSRPHYDWVSWADMQDLKRASRSFEALATYHYDLINLTGDANHAPEALYGVFVSASLFPMLGVKPMLGRNIFPEEEHIGHDQELILSYGVWARRFGSDQGVIGKSVEVNGRQRTIVGVMPPGFDFPLRLSGITRTSSQHMDFWAPEAVDPAKIGRILGYCAVARLKPGVTVSSARDEARSFASDLAQRYPVTNAGRSLDIVAFRAQTLGPAESGLWLLMGAAVLFMLIGCANVTNLLLARSLTRQREISVRLALGAGPKRILQQLITESCVLAVAGGLAGFVLTAVAWKLLPALAPVSIPRLAETRADGSVLAFAVAIAIVNGILFGLAPALRSASSGIAYSLRESGARGSVGCARSRLRSSLVVAEVAVAVTLVLVGGVLIASFLRLLSTDPGFDKNVLASIIVPASNQYDTVEKHELLFRRIVDAVRAAPGVQLAGTVDVLPFSGANNGGSVVRADDPAATERGHGLPIEFDHVSADYLPAMGVGLLDGRWFRDDDLASNRTVAIINDALARKLWPDQSAIGREICLNCYGANFRERRRVVGVVRSVRHAGLDDLNEFQVYETAHAYEYADFVVVRTSRPASEMTKTVRRAVASVDPKQPVFLSVPMSQLIGDSVADRRFIVLLIAITGLLALLLAAAGIYGVISYTTSLRTSEIGLRMALGAQPRNVQALVFRGGLLLAATGIVIGVGAALAITRALGNLLVGLSANDPLPMISSVALVLVTSALACWIPAHRATRIDPLAALREN
jgi:predicted permease